MTVESELTASRTPPATRMLRYETFRDLYFAERDRRESVRGSIGIPAAGLSFALYAFITLSSKLNLGVLPRHAPSILMVALAVLAVALLFASVWRVLRAEWHFVYNEPPALEEFLRLETEIRRQHAQAPEAEIAQRIDAETRDLLTSAYYLAYQRYVVGNTHSARQRTWSLRLVFVGVLLLFLSTMLLPWHLAAGS